MVSACRRALLLVVLACLSFSASALVPKADAYRGSIDFATASYPTRGVAATAACPRVGAVAAGEVRTCDEPVLSGTRWISIWHTCAGTNCYASGNFEILTLASAACPANSTPAGSACQCNANFDESGGQCVAHTNACTAKAGKPFTLRVTIGYTRTPDDTDTRAIGSTFNPWAGASVCSGGCTMDFSSVDAAWVSQSPNAQGLYRNAVDASYVNSGKECTASGTSAADQAVNTQAPQPDCPGYVGEVNGKTGCYGTAAKPVTTVPKPTGIPQPPPQAGNPPAGERPVSGEGSAANPTPAAGNGGPAGGPAAAGAGGKGGGAGGTSDGKGTTKNADGKDEPTPCGAPGQAVCAVKVDEKGTPENGGDGMSTTKLNEAMDKLDQGIAKAIDKSSMDTSWGGIPSWFASSSCQPWNLGTLPIINTAVIVNICAVEPYVVGVMSFLWVVGTFFAIVAMVGRVTGAGVN